MPNYRFRAAHPSGKIHKGHMSAINEDDLSTSLRNAGLELIEAKASAPPEKLAITPWGRQRVGLRQRVIICRQLKSLLLAGVPFLDALDGVVKTLHPGPLRDKLSAISRNVSQGGTIAAAFGEHPDLFSPIFLAILDAGEKGGDLAATFGYLGDFLDRQARLQDQFGRAVRYPLFLLALATGVIVFMLTTVVPRVLDFLNTIKSEQPWPTQLLVNLSTFVMDHGGMLFAGLLAIAALFFVARRMSSSFALRSDGWLLSLPRLGPALHKIALARFAHSLVLLMNSGSDIPSSLATAKTVLGNRALIAAADGAIVSLQAGQSFSSATQFVFPPLAAQMLGVGEQSGALIKTLEDVAYTFDAESQEAVSSFIGALEPALTLLVGAILAWVVLAVLGPVYGSLNQLSASGAI